MGGVLVKKMLYRVLYKSEEIPNNDWTNQIDNEGLFSVVTDMVNAVSVNHFQPELIQEFQNTSFFKLNLLRSSF